MLEALRKEVWTANVELPRKGLVTCSWGNASGIDRARGLVVIKPSGVDYETMTPDDLVVVELATGRVAEGRLNPSSDTRTHLELYKAFPALGGIVHTHSTCATAWAQAGRDLPCYGTTHADTFYGPVPCTRPLTREEVEGDYEKNTGAVIAGEFARRGLDPLSMPAVLCGRHGPFTWGADAGAAAQNALILEEVARLALLTLQLEPAASPTPQYLLDKHFLRKHGPDAYYGQK